MEQAIMATGVILIGLMLVGLLVQSLNQVRLSKMMKRILLMEERIITKVSSTYETSYEIHGEPMTLEDYLKRDFEEMLATMEKETKEETK